MAFDWTTAAAIYGAVLSTVLGGAKLWESIRNRTVVEVTLYKRLGGPGDGGGLYCVTKIVKKGTRPVTISELGAERTDGGRQPATKFWPSDLTLPVTLKESMQFEGFIHVGGGTAFAGGNFRCGFAEGSDGKVWRSKRAVPALP